MKLLLKNLLFTLAIPGAVAVYFPLWIARDAPLGSVSALLILGVVLLAFGALIYLWTLWDFAVIGRGTPLPVDAPRQLVVRGLYRYVRNPMYLGVLSAILGWSVIFADGWLLVYALGVGILVHLFVIFYEEPRLLVLFGQEYALYRSQVSRWIPRLPGGS